MFNKGRFAADLLLFVVAIIWGSGFIAQKYGQFHVGPFTFNAYRFLIGAVLVAPIALYQTRHHLSSWLNLRGVFIGIILSLAALCQQTGMSSTTAGKAGFITGLYLVIIPFLAWIFFRAKISRQSWVGAGVAVMGLLILSWPEDFSINKGDVWVLFSAVLFSLHVVVVERIIHGENSFQLAVLQYVTVAVTSFLGAYLMGEPSSNNVSLALNSILYSGVVSVTLAYTAQIIAQRYTSATEAGLLLSLESVFALIFGVAILSEVLTTRGIIGSLLMFIGCVIPLIPYKRQREEAP